MHPSVHQVWMSNAKPTASLLVEILISEGLIDETQSVAQYIPEFEGTSWEEVTVTQVMNMGAGLDIDDTAESHAD